MRTLLMTPKKKGGWQPGANTVLYLPLNSTDTHTDKSGNSVSTTNTGVIFGTYQGADCGYFNGSSKIDVGNITFTSTSTILCRCYFVLKGGNQFDRIIDFRASGSNIYNIGYSENSSYKGYYNWIGNDLYHNGYTYNGQRVLIGYTLGGGTDNFYIKGNSININVQRSKSNSGFTATNNHVGCNESNAENWNGGLSKLIIENRQRTATEVSDYYNQTKSLYGIS